MAGNTPPRSGETGAAGTPKSIKNTFAPDCENKYFDAGALFSLCKFGFPFDKLPEVGQKMVLEYIKEYDKKCTKTGDVVDIPPIPDDPNIMV